MPYKRIQLIYPLIHHFSSTYNLILHFSSWNHSILAPRLIQDKSDPETHLSSYFRKIDNFPLSDISFQQFHELKWLIPSFGINFLSLARIRLCDKKKRKFVFENYQMFHLFLLNLRIFQMFDCCLLFRAEKLENKI